MLRKSYFLKICLTIFITLELFIIVAFVFNPNFLSSLFEPDYICRDCNIVLISIDTLRADHLGVYGYERNTSPNIDKLASESFVFKNAYSQASLTTPSVMSLFTSLYPSVHKVCLIIHTHDYCESSLSNSDILLTEILNYYGYTTGGFIDAGQVSSFAGFSRGFDIWNEYEDRLNQTRHILETLDWLENSVDKKFFLFFHTYVVHDPYIPPKEFQQWVQNESDIYTSQKHFLNDVNLTGLGHRELFWKNVSANNSNDIKQVVALYDGEILYSDELVGMIISKLQELGVYNKTIIVFTSDHGEEFWEHGGVLHWKLYNEILHVPLIIKIPNTKTQIIEHFVSLIDVVPTILELLSINAISQFQGSSLMPIVNGEEFNNRIILSESVTHYEKAIIKNNWKLITTKNGSMELYNIKDDFYEQTILTEQFPETVDYLQRQLNVILEDIHST